MTGQQHTPGRVDADTVRSAVNIVDVIGRVVRLRRQGKEFVGLCPFHKEKTPSFNVNPEKDGGVYKCFGCTAEGDVFTFIQKLEGIDFRAAISRVQEMSGLPPAAIDTSLAPPSARPGPIVAKYPYVDEQGNVLFEVCRHEPGENGKKKSFHQRVPLGKGQYAYSVQGVRKVLYRLPEVLKSPEVWVVEGEKDVHTLTQLGLVATTASGGAEAPWLDEYTETLRWKKLILCPDTDLAGANRHAQLMAALTGAAETIRTVALPGEYKDVTEYIEAGHSLDDLKALIAAPITTGPKTTASNGHHPTPGLMALVEEIIASKDVGRCYDERLFALCAEDSAAAIIARTKLKTAFKDLVFRAQGDAGWDQKWRLAIQKHKSMAVVPVDDPADNSGLQTVIVTNRQLRDISSDALAEIRRMNEPPTLFSRSGTMVHVVRDEKERPSVAVVTESYLRGVLARTANFMRYNERGEMRHCFPPLDIVKDILSMNPEDWGVPYLSAVTEVPVLRPDGTVVDAPGYDAVASVYYIPASGFAMPPLPAKPTQVDVEDAVAVIDEAVGEFPYDSAASRANLFGLLLTPILRPALAGATPLAVIDAPQAGTGKGLLVDVVSLIATGRPAAMVPYPYRDDEMQKQIGALLLDGTQFICFDNVEGDLKSPILCQALTEKEHLARILGFSRNMLVPNLSTWIVTGNNIRPAGDMPRRCYQIRLNARSSKPFMGRSFKHPKLAEWVTANRAALLHALLTIARYWYSRGAVNMIEQAVTVGSFEDWHRTIGSILAAAKVGPFLGNYEVFMEEEDEGPRQWEAFLLALHSDFPSSDNASAWFTVSDMLDKIEPRNSIIPSAARDVIPADLADAWEKKSNPHIVIGKMLQRRRDRRYGYGEDRCWLERESGAAKGAARWRVVTSRVSDMGYELDRPA